MAAVIRLGPDDAERYARLRLRMLSLAPWAFGATPEDDEALGVAHLAEVFAGEHHATFAIEADDSGRCVLVAAASVTRAASPKFSHRARVWGVFVEPGWRGRGFGRAVVGAAIGHARSWRRVEFLDLGVSANSPEARRLYESFGFAMWGREPEATEHDGRRYDEIHMTRRLGASPPPARPRAG